MSRAVKRFTRNNLPLPAAPANLWQVSVLGLLDNQVTINTFYYQDGGAALIPATEQNLGTGFSIVWKNTYINNCSNDFTVTAFRIQCLTTPTRNAYLFTTGLPVTCVGGAGHLPSTVAMVIQRKTGFKGQSGRGRVMWPAVPPAFATNSALSAAGNGAATSVSTQLGVGFTASTVTYSPCVVSRRGKAPAVIYGSAPILNTGFQTTLGTVRRRRIGRGK